MPSLATLITILALLFALVAVVLLPRARLDSDRRFWCAVAATALPSVLVLLAFLSDVSGRRILVVVGAVLVGLTYAVSVGGINMLRTVRTSLSAGGLLALLTAVGTLMTFGAMLQVRLDYQRNPLGGPLDGATLEALSEYSGSLVLVPLVLALGSAYLHFRQKRHWIPPRWMRHRYSLLLVAPCVILVLFALPITQGGAARLTFWGAAVSEWLRPLAFLMLAAIMSRYQTDLLPVRGRVEKLPLLIVLGFSAALGVIAVLRNDYGSILPFAFGLAAMGATLHFRSRDAVLRVAGHEDSRALNPLSSQAGRFVASLATVIAAVLILLLTFVNMPIMKGRIAPFQDPWQFPWAVATCTASPQVPAWLTPGVSPETGVRYDAPVPAGYTLCYETLDDSQKAAQSQIARSLTAVDGGGLWGRGLSDVEARIVPVVESDFVLAGVWSKLGGIVVTLLTLLAIAVWVVITRGVSLTPWQSRAGARGNKALLFASGIGVALAGQAVYVLAATVNLLPHSGVPFPFLARGGQAMAGLLLSLVILVALVARMPAHEPDGVAQWRPAAATRRRPITRRFVASCVRSFGVIGAVATTLLALIVGIALPFASRNPFNLTAGLGHQGVQNALATRDAAPIVSLSGTVALTQNRGTGAWQVPAGVPEQLPLHDLFGVLRVAKGGTGGMVDALAAPALGAPTTRTIADRLAVHDQGQRRIDLTVDPLLQRTVAQAARSQLPDGTRLPAGVVVLNPDTGAVLALTSAPDEIDPLAGVASDDEKKAWEGLDDQKERPRNTGFGEILPGGVLKAPDQSDCKAERTTCARYRLQFVPRKIIDVDYLRTYVGGSSAYTLPKPNENRAAGRGYNLGSTFKIVIAAAYLEKGGKITDFIVSPAAVKVGPRVIKGTCRGTVNGKITVADALQVSCNTAFIALARAIGWSNVSATAHRLGFTLTGPTLPAPSNTRWPAPSRVPARADRETVGVLALGGGDLVGTPVQMATLMGAIANGGTHIQPYIITSTTDEDGRVTRVTPSRSAALTPATVAGLRQGLAEVTGEGGTLASIPIPDGIEFYGKSGTQVVRKEAASGTYTSRYYWVVGAAAPKDRRKGPITFAVVVEGHDALRGHEHVRAVAAAILQAYGDR